MKFAMAAVVAALASTSAYAQVNIGTQAPEAPNPFVLTQVTTFNQPWRIAFLPDGRMLITEKPGALWVTTQAGAKTKTANRSTPKRKGAPRFQRSSVALRKQARAASASGR